MNEQSTSRRGGDVDLQVGLESFERFREVVRARQTARVAVEQVEASRAARVRRVGCREERVESVNDFHARGLPAGREAHGEFVEHAGVVRAYADARAVTLNGEASRPAQAVNLRHSSRGSLEPR